MADRAVLTARQREELQRALTGDREARLYRRVLALLEVDVGRPVTEVAKDLHVSRRSVHTWLRSYRASGLEALVEQPRPGRPSVWDEESRDLLEQLLGQSPEAYGYLATTWTVPLLREQLEHSRGRLLSAKTVRRELHARGYSWKRSRYVLEPDPERGEKGAPSAAALGPPGAAAGDPGGR